MSYKNSIWSVYSPLHLNIHANNQTRPIIYGVNVDMSELLPDSQRYVINSKGEDLIDIAHKLGINTFRITSSEEGFPNTNSLTVYTKDQWDKVLNKMEHNGIKAIILVEAPELNPRDFSQTYLNFLQSYLLDNNVISNPDIYAIDIKNEPLITQDHLMVLQQAANRIKQKNSSMLITIGAWKIQNPNPKNADDQFIWDDPNTAKSLSNFVDFYSLHVYGFDKPNYGILPNPNNLTQYAIDQIHSNIPDKPILIEEFGSGNGDRITDQNTIGSKELQANVYNGVYSTIQEQSDYTIGSIAYTFYAQDINTDGWNIVQEGANTLYPAAYVIQKFALGRTSIPISLPMLSVPNDYMYTSENNAQTVSIARNDIVGLQLNLDRNSTYSVIINPSSNLLQTERLKYNDQQNNWYAVFHALRSGMTHIAITSNPPCDPSAGCLQNTSFTLNINIK